MAESYYSARARRDSQWRLRAIRAAGERYRRAFEADPEQVRDVSSRYRERLREHSLSYRELRERAALDDRCADLRAVLEEELERGTVERVKKRYRLNGSLPADVVEALRRLAPGPGRARVRSRVAPSSARSRRARATVRGPRPEIAVDRRHGLFPSRGLDWRANVALGP